MALLHATVRIWPEHLDQLAVAHVDHCLRDQHSQEDAEFVQLAANSLGIRCYVRVCDVPAVLERESGSTEEIARRLRYEALQQIAEDSGFGLVACAHHQDDQAETVLHNILRGTGLRGLRGMSRSRLLGDSVRLIRPLLDLSRSDLVEFLQQEGLNWRTDDSNESTEFTRNRIRSQLLPLLAKEYNPQISSSLVKLAELASDAEQMEELVAERCLDDVLLELQPGICRLRRDRLPLWPVGAVRAMLRLIWHRQSWPQQSMTRTHWHQLAASLMDPQATADDVPGVEISATPTIIRLFRAGQAK